MSLPSTRFSGLGVGAAGVILAAVAVTIIALVAFTLVHRAPASSAVVSPNGGGDLATYARIIERLRDGEAYYPAVHAELLADGYGTRSVFNWRTPIYFSLLALAPDLARLGLGLLAIAAASLTFLLFRRDGGDAFALGGGVLMLLASAAVIVPGAQLFAEVPAGMLIVISVACYGLGLRAPGIAAAIAALFIRELAAPYALVCGLIALSDRRWREVWIWIAAVAVYAAYFAWHAFMVHAALGPADKAYAEGWLQFGGLGFILATAAFNGVMIAAPVAASAALLPLSALGLSAWPGATGARAGATVALYAALFAFFGKPFNVYWGALYAPLLTLAVPWAVAATRDLVAGVRRGLARPAGRGFRS